MPITVSDVVNQLGVQVLCAQERLENQITGGYASDLLSCVMAGAAAGNVWVTLQAHPNVVAVADLLGLACVIVTEGTAVSEDTLTKAQEKNIPILLTQHNTFMIVAQLAHMGVGEVE